MPFKSEAQRRYMYAKHPRIAERWQSHTPKNKELPEKVAFKMPKPSLDQLLLSGTIAGATSIPLIAALAYNKKLKDKEMAELIEEAENARMNSTYPLNKVAMSPDKIQKALMNALSGKAKDINKTMKGATPIERLNALMQGHVDTLSSAPKATGSLFNSAMKSSPDELAALTGRMSLPNSLDTPIGREILAEGLQKHLAQQRSNLSSPKIQQALREMADSGNVGGDAFKTIQEATSVPGMQGLGEDVLQNAITGKNRGDFPWGWALGLGLPAAGVGAGSIAYGAGKAKDKDEQLKRLQATMPKMGMYKEALSPEAVRAAVLKYVRMNPHATDTAHKFQRAINKSMEGLTGAEGQAAREKFRKQLARNQWYGNQVDRVRRGGAAAADWVTENPGKATALGATGLGLGTVGGVAGYGIGKGVGRREGM
jgi:hypothetical protein